MTSPRAWTGADQTQGKPQAEETPRVTEGVYGNPRGKGRPIERGRKTLRLTEALYEAIREGYQAVLLGVDQGSRIDRTSPVDSTPLVHS